jgi:hypothetical protein
MSANLKKESLRVFWDYLKFSDNYKKLCEIVRDNPYPALNGYVDIDLGINSKIPKAIVLQNLFSIYSNYFWDIYYFGDIYNQEFEEW